MWTDEAPQPEDGPIKIIDPNEVSKEPRDLIEGFEWVTMDLMDEQEVSKSSEIDCAQI